MFGIEAVKPGVDCRGPVHAVGVVDVGFEILDKDMPDVARPIEARIEIDFEPRFDLSRGKYGQQHAAGMPREDRKINSIAAERGPQRQWCSAAKFQHSTFGYSTSRSRMPSKEK